MKNKKGQITQVIISLAVLLIIGVVVLQVIFSQISDQTSTTAISDDPFTSTNGTCVSLTTSCIVDGSATVQNVTNGLTSTGNYTECDSRSDSKIDGLLLKVSGADPNLDGVTMNASYNQRSCAFITGGITTTVLNNLPVLFAVLLLVIVAAAIVIK